MSCEDEVQSCVMINIDVHNGDGEFKTFLCKLLSNRICSSTNVDVFFSLLFMCIHRIRVGESPTKID